MNLSGEIIVFVHEFEYTNGKGVLMQGLRYNTSVSRKDEEGDYLNASLEVVFSKGVADSYKLERDYGEGDMLKVAIDEGWLTCRGWEDKDGNQRRVLQAFINTVEDIALYVPEDKKKATKKTTKKSSQNRKK